jgi:alkanesulfonate monooxygenase SsuD/methylene tetrahydromethanopterin reductase-like flavin-dependent oxidoreductase (luciferase family)
VSNAKEDFMQYGLTVYVNDPRAIAELTREAESAGWDGFFIPDALGIETKDFPAAPWYDPEVTLAAMVMRSERIRIGTFISAVTRRRPWKLARQIGTLDQLSNGRIILAVGLGAADGDGGFYKVGEAMDLKTRAALLDETLAIMAGLWTGQPFSFSGEHYQVQEMTMLPPPVQKPRVPIWVVGVWPKPKSMQRALRWDGIIPQKYGATPDQATAIPAEYAAIKKYIEEHRSESGAFEIVTGGSTPANSRKKAIEKVESYARAGATWWIENIWSHDPEKASARIKKGPPRPD